MGWLGGLVGGLVGGCKYYFTDVFCILETLNKNIFITSLGDFPTLSFMKFMSCPYFA